jgi:hypothetical protein
LLWFRLPPVRPLPFRGSEMNRSRATLLFEKDRA